jgi:hypothetical protein
MQQVRLSAGDVVTLRVIPEHDPSLGVFELRVTVRWVRADAIWQAVGGTVEPLGGAAGESVFHALVEYYAGGGPTSGPSPRPA